MVAGWVFTKHFMGTSLEGGIVPCSRGALYPVFSKDAELGSESLPHERYEWRAAPP
jgi:hypothetical protein